MSALKIAAVEQAETVIKHHAEETRTLCELLGVAEQEVVKAWVLWDTGINAYTNGVYHSNALRIAMHLHNLMPGSWHDKRQKIVLEHLRAIRPQRIVDVGFGTPQRYVFEYVLQEGVWTEVRLADKDPTAFSFAHAVFKARNVEWRGRIGMVLHDMDRDAPLAGDCYLFQDSLEHARHPVSYLWRTIDRASPGTRFIFSLPIEINGAVPEHHVWWESDADAVEWLLDAGLNALTCEQIRMDLEKDLFAHCLHEDFHELVVVAEKR